MADADTLTPMADLASRWGVTANTVSRRLAFLGLKPIRQGNLRFITAEQLSEGDALQDHIVSGKPMEAFPRVDQAEGGLVARRVTPSAQVTGLVPADQLAGILAALAGQQQPPADPLRSARALAEAASLGVPLSSVELAGVLGMSAATVSSWADGHSPRPGFTLRRQKAGVGVWWLVERPGQIVPVDIRSTSHATSRTVGFAQVFDVQAITLPNW